MRWTARRHDQAVFLIILKNGYGAVARTAQRFRPDDAAAPVLRMGIWFVEIWLDLSNKFGRRGNLSIRSRECRAILRQNLCIQGVGLGCPGEGGSPATEGGAAAIQTRSRDMSKHRTNPDTGVHEQQDGIFDTIFDIWNPVDYDD